MSETYGISDTDIQTAIAECLGESNPAVMVVANRHYPNKPPEMSDKDWTLAVQSIVQNYAASQAASVSPS